MWQREKYGSRGVTLYLLQQQGEHEIRCGRENVAVAIVEFCCRLLRKDSIVMIMVGIVIVTFDRCEWAHRSDNPDCASPSHLALQSTLPLLPTRHSTPCNLLQHSPCSSIFTNVWTCVIRFHTPLASKQLLIIYTLLDLQQNHMSLSPIARGVDVGNRVSVYKRGVVQPTMAAIASLRVDDSQYVSTISMIRQRYYAQPYTLTRIWKTCGQFQAILPAARVDISRLIHSLTYHFQSKFVLTCAAQSIQ